MNLMKRSSHVTMKCLADINPDFMKPYFIIKETPYNLRDG